MLAKIVNKMSEALEGTYAELLELIPLQTKLNIDETGRTRIMVSVGGLGVSALDLYTLYAKLTRVATSRC